MTVWAGSLLTDGPVSSFEGLEVDTQVRASLPERERDVGVEVVDIVMIHMRTGFG